MDICIMRNYSNFIPRGNLRFDHAVLLLHQHKDDLFLNVMDKYLQHSAHVTVLLQCKVGRNGTFYQNNLHAQYFSSKLRESIHVIPSPRAYVERHYTAMYRPSITVTDDLESEVYLRKYCPQYYNYASNHFCQLNISDCIEGLNLAHPIDLCKFDHQLSLFSCSYLRHKICIKTIIQILPPCFIFFTAFGDYKEKNRFQEVINSFILFKYKYDKYFGHEIMLVLGGEFLPPGSAECKYRRYLRSALERLRRDHNVIFLKKALNQAEKKTLLRLSYAAVYLDNSPDFEDIKFAMSLGTPIICSNNGYGACMVEHGTSGFIVDPKSTEEIASCMETLSIPTVYHRFSTATRKAYLKKYSETSFFLQTVSVDEIPNFAEPEITINTGAPSTSVVNADFIQSVNNFNIQNDWYVKNEYSANNKHQSVFGEDTARTENAHCEQIPKQKEFFVNPSIDIYPEFTFEYVTLPRWSEEDEVSEKMHGDHLVEIEPVGQVEIKDPSLYQQPDTQDNLNAGYQLNQPNQPIQSYQPPSVESYQSPSIELYQRPPLGSYQPPPVDTYKPPLIETYQPKPSELYKRPPFESYQRQQFESNKSASAETYQPPSAELYQSPPAGNYQPPPAGNYQPPPAGNYQPPPAGNYQPPPAGNYQPAPAGNYQPPLIQNYQRPPIKSFDFPPVKPYQLPPGEQYMSLPNYSIESHMAQLHSKENMQSLKPIQPHFNPSMQKPHQLSPIQLYPSINDHPIEPQMTKSYLKETKTIQTHEPIQPHFNQSLYKPFQVPPVEPYQSLPNRPMDPQMTQSYSKETTQSFEPKQPHIKQLMQPFQPMLPHSNQAMQHDQPVQQLLNQPMQQLQKHPMQQHQYQPMQQLQNQPMQQPQNLPMQQVQNQPMQLQNQPMQQFQNISMQQLQKLSMQQLQNLPMHQLQNLSMLQLQNEPVQQREPVQQHPNQAMQPQQKEAMQFQPNPSMQLHQNQAMQSYQMMQPNPNKTVQPFQANLQQNQYLQSTQPTQVSPNQQNIRPYYVGIMKQSPPQVMQPNPMPNYPRPQLIAPNQPAWVQMPPTPAESQFSGSEDSTPRQYFEAEGGQNVEYGERDVNADNDDSSRRWEEVFANDSVDEYSAHDSDLSETHEDAWSGICSDDTPSTGDRSWRVFNQSLHSNSQYSDDVWEEANLDSGNEKLEEENEIQYYDDDHEINEASDVEKVTVAVNKKNRCKECRDEECVKELHAKVDAKLENNQGIDTSFPKRSKSARRKANKRRMKRVLSGVSD